MCVDQRDDVIFREGGVDVTVTCINSNLEKDSWYFDITIKVCRQTTIITYTIRSLKQWVGPNKTDSVSYG